MFPICFPTVAKKGKQNNETMVTTSVVFDHRGRTKKGRPGPIEIRVTVERRPYYINSGVKVLASEWKYGAVVNRGDAAELNERVRAIGLAVEREVNACIREMRPVDVADIRRRVWGVHVYDEDAAPFLDWYEEQLPQLGVAVGTLRHYVTTLARLRACNIIRYWTDLKVENIYKFDTYLHSLKKQQSDVEKKMKVKEQPIGDAAIHTYHKNLKAMCARAVRVGLLSANPYDRLKGAFKKGVKESVEYLTEEEVAAFMSLRPVAGTTMAAARDLFVFQLYTGMSYSDAQRFDIKNYKQVNGKWVAIGERVKTGVPFVSQLLPPVIDVLERYNWQVPKMFNGEYNQCLKALGMAAGITTRMHSHLARHTFATWMLRNGVKVENLARMLGHTQLDQTLRYAKVVAQSVHEDFDMIAAKMKNQQ